MAHRPDETIHALNTSLTAWTANAAFWDAQMGRSGNDFFRELELPALERLAAPVRRGDRVLDLATGNGLVARRMAALGAGDVLATDGSGAMVECARRRGEEEDGGEAGAGVRYRVLDVTKEGDWAEVIGEAREHDGFDVVAMNMAIMDVPTLEPLASALPKLLKPGGRFVATLLHPAFMSTGAARHIELGENPDTGRFETMHSVSVKRYLDIPAEKDEALPGQPEPQIYFHRSMEQLLRPFFAHGMFLTGLEEPCFKNVPDGEKIQSYRNFPQIPQIFAIRLERR